jgi:2-octaprenyl-6-methoxyphenol hydroxylase
MHADPTTLPASHQATQFDLAIVGGGMVGVTAALCFAQLGYRIALVESIAPDAAHSSSFDQRAIALAASSVAIYRSLGLWPQLQSLANPIEAIHVSDQGNFGFTRLFAKDYDLPALGQVIPLELAGPALWQQVSQQPLIQTYCPSKVSACQQDSQWCHLTLVLGEDSSGESLPNASGSVEPTSMVGTENKISVRAKLVLAADGTFSSLATANQIQVERTTYGQHAIIANIQTEQPHRNRAFERFTAGGPLALLPLTQQRMSLVWCHKPETVESTLSLTDEAFCQQLQAAFGYRLGRITRVGQRFHYPLSLHRAQQPFQGRVLLIGNALHTLHPIAGQGFNLGLRDISALNDLLLEAKIRPLDIGSESLLKRYVEGRTADWQQSILATDGLARLFSNEFLPLQIIRNKMMSLLNAFPPAKAHLANAAMGYQQRASRLARGLANPNHDSVES